MVLEKSMRTFMEKFFRRFLKESLNQEIYKEKFEIFFMKLFEVISDRQSGKIDEKNLEESPKIFCKATFREFLKKYFKAFPELLEPCIPAFTMVI